MNPTHVFRYDVDAQDRIVGVSEEWVAFARENAATHLHAGSVVGHELLDFVTGEELGHLYRMILDRVRNTGRKVVLPFRCDGPALRRFMELEIEPAGEGRLAFAGRLVRSEPRASEILLDPAVEHSDAMLTICSWCKRVDCRGEWVEVEEAVARLGLFEASAVPQLSHGMCAECARAIRAEGGLPPLP